MITITRKYEIGCTYKNKEFVEKKLNEFGISVHRIKTNSNSINNILGREICSVYFQCTSSEEEMDDLIEYFQLKYRGCDVSIIY